MELRKTLNMVLTSWWIPIIDEVLSAIITYEWDLRTDFGVISNSIPVTPASVVCQHFQTSSSLFSVGSFLSSDVYIFCKTMIETSCSCS